MSDATLPRTLPLGTLKLGEQIGSGGYGVVYKAALEPFRRTFAVKILNPSPFHTDLEKTKLRFVSEAEILMDLRHPNITPIYGVGEHEGRPYIVMEYFAGHNLYDARNIGVPDPEVVLPFIELVCLALGHAHAKNIVHRDIKPSNLLTRRGDARVVDFGIAHVLDPDGERFTRTGGTPVGDAFAAPELVDNPRLVDQRCDIYSLGACWFWLLTGTTPRGRNWEGALRAIGKMTKSYENIVLKTLDQADKRYQSMEQLVQDVRVLRSGGEPGANKDGDLDDDAALVLGAIFTHFLPGSDPTSAYRLEQELSGHLSRFALGVGLSTLRKRGLIVEISVSGWNDEPWVGLRTTDAGDDWVRDNRARVARLLASVTGDSNMVRPADDDIPF